MIQFALLFSLGFLTATLLGALVAPVVHRRIVRFAEDRLKATTPLTQQEVRAQKDAARAIFAAENVRTSQTLKRERDRAISLMLAREKAEQDARAARKDNEELRAQIDQMNVEAGDLRSGLRLMEQHIERLKAALETLETDYAAKTEQASLLARQLDRVSAELDEVRVLSAAGALQADDLHARANGLRDEREALREEQRRSRDTIAVLERKLEQQDARARQLESRLTTANAQLADRETSLLRRTVDLDRLTARNKDMAKDLIAAQRALREAGLTPSAETAIAVSAQAVDVPSHSTDTVERLLQPDLIRAEAAQFLDRLVTADPSEDDAAREALLRIAAGMTAMTALSEGPSSPIPALLARNENRPEGSGATARTLADRTRALLASTS